MRFWWFFFQWISYSTISFLILEVISSWMSCVLWWGVWCLPWNKSTLYPGCTKATQISTNGAQAGQQINRYKYFSFKFDYYYKNNRNKKARKCLVLLVTLDLILLIEEKNVVTSLWWGRLGHSRCGTF